MSAMTSKEISSRFLENNPNYRKEYYENNKEKFKERYEANKERRKEYMREYAKRNLQKRLAYEKLNPWLRTYKNIFQRCNNPNDKAFKYYGGRGIKCDITVEQVKELYIRDKASLMKQASIDRKDINGNYTFDNCQFIEMDINRVKTRKKSIY